MRENREGVVLAPSNLWPNLFPPHCITIFFTMNIGLPYQRYTLTLPAGHVGVHFSTTIPCEIKKIEPDSPIIGESIEFLGRLAFHVCIPNKIEVVGALDKLTLEFILAAYCNVPHRKYYSRTGANDLM